jgi:hypothetical protein
MILAGTDLTGARTVLERCMDLRSESGTPAVAAIHWVLGVALHLSGDEDGAAGQWKTAETLDPELDRFIENSPQLEQLKSLLDKK